MTEADCVLWLLISFQLLVLTLLLFPDPSREAFSPPLEPPVLTALPKGRMGGTLKPHQEDPISMGEDNLSQTQQHTQEKAPPRRLGCENSKL